MNLKLCEALGWENHSWELHPDSAGARTFAGLWIKNGVSIWRITELPNHFADTTEGLWACHQAEREITEAQHTIFRRILADNLGLSHHYSFRQVISAPAPQRALALYLTLTNPK